MQSIYKSLLVIFSFIFLAGCPDLQTTNDGELYVISYSISQQDGTYDGFFTDDTGPIEIFQEFDFKNEGLFTFSLEEVPENARITRCQIDFPVSSARPLEMETFRFAVRHVDFGTLGTENFQVDQLNNPNSADPGQHDIVFQKSGIDIRDGGTIRIVDITTWCKEDFEFQRGNTQYAIRLNHDEFDAVTLIQVVFEEGIPFGDAEQSSTARRPFIRIDYN